MQQSIVKKNIAGTEIFFFSFIHARYLLSSSLSFLRDQNRNYARTGLHKYNDTTVREYTRIVINGSIESVRANRWKQEKFPAIVVIWPQRIEMSGTIIIDPLSSLSVYIPI